MVYWLLSKQKFVFSWTTAAWLLGWSWKRGFTVTYLSDLSHLLHSEDGVVGLFRHPLESCDELLRLRTIHKKQVNTYADMVRIDNPDSKVMSKQNNKNRTFLVVLALKSWHGWWWDIGLEGGIRCCRWRQQQRHNSVIISIYLYYAVAN